MMGWLEAHGQADSTLMLVTSDNGGLFDARAPATERAGR